MVDPLAAYSFSVVAGVLAGLLLYSIVGSGFRHPQARQLYLAALALTVASWSGLEWGLWLGGENLFRLIVYPAVPLDVFFAVWAGFAVWVGERLGQRKLAVGWLALLAAIFVVASWCMDCVRF